MSNEYKTPKENLLLSYQYRNEGLEIKIKTMRLLNQKMELLEEKAQSCNNDEELLKILNAMAALGQAIIPD